MPLNIPNILTVFRLLAAPCVGLAFAFFARPFADYLAVVLFVAAAVTDYLDGLLARRWKQISNFGRMLDPIADKAMVVIAIAVVVGLTWPNPYILIPAVVIMLREVFVSGLREFLGGSVILHVTRIAKWKTTVQLLALGVLLTTSLLSQELQIAYGQMDPFRFEQVVTGVVTDDSNLYAISVLFEYGYWSGLGLLWIAAILTAISGWDYFVKSRPYLKDAEVGDQST